MDVCTFDCEPCRRKAFTRGVYEMISAEMQRRRAMGGEAGRALNIAVLTKEMLRAECMPHALIIDEGEK